MSNEQPSNPLHGMKLEKVLTKPSQASWMGKDGFEDQYQLF